ncbi:hypothetical protein ACTAQI_11715 [Pseudarthrobacter sp. alpha12b]
MGAEEAFVRVSQFTAGALVDSRDLPPAGRKPREQTAARRVAGYLLLAISLAGFIAALEVTYAAFMAPRFGYLGYVYHEPSHGWMFAVYLLLLVAAGFLPYRTQQASGFAVWFLYVALLVPIATVPLYGSTRDPADTFLFAFYCAAIWACVALILRRSPTPVIPVRQSRPGLFWVIIVSVSLVTYTYIQIVFGITFNIVSFFEVYDTRLLYRDEVVPTVPVLGYLIANQGNVINPLLMAMGVVRRRPPLFVVGLVGQLILYSTTGYKTVMISIPLAVTIALYLRHRRSLTGITIVVASTILVWAAITIDRVASLGMVDIVVSRIYLTAGYLMPHYRDVYDGAPWALWDYSFLGPLVDAPYAMTPGFYVGAMALGRPDIQANAGLFADGYANLGLAGIAIEAVALVAILLLADGASRHLPLAVVLPTALLPVFSLANGSPFTAFLSYGFALMMLLFALLPAEEALSITRKDVHSRRLVRRQERRLGRFDSPVSLGGSPSEGDLADSDPKRRSDVLVDNVGSLDQHESCGAPDGSPGSRCRKSR